MVSIKMNKTLSKIKQKSDCRKPLAICRTPRSSLTFSSCFFRGQTAGRMSQLIYILVENHTSQVLLANSMLLGHKCWIRITEFPRINYLDSD